MRAHEVATKFLEDGNPDAKEYRRRIDELRSVVLFKERCAHQYRQVAYDLNIPEGADVMTVEDFKDSVASGAFVDDDGHGQLCQDKMSGLLISPSDLEGGVDWKGATHVAWFNK